MLFIKKWFQEFAYGKSKSAYNEDASEKFADKDTSRKENRKGYGK